MEGGQDELFAEVADRELLQEEIRCVDSEISMRRRVYKRWVDEGRMRVEDAKRKVWLMMRVRKRLTDLLETMS